MFVLDEILVKSHLGKVQRQNQVKTKEIAFVDTEQQGKNGE